MAVLMIINGKTVILTTKDFTGYSYLSTHNY